MVNAITDLLDFTQVQPVAAGYSGAMCGCGYLLNLLEAAELGRTFEDCPHCGEFINEREDCVLFPQASAMYATTEPGVRGTTWYHLTQRENWLASAATHGITVYVGTLLAALIRARDLTEFHDAPVAPWYLHALRLAPEANILPGVWADGDNHVSRMTMAEAGMNDADVIRYLNTYEDPGSISLEVNARLLRGASMRVLDGTDLRPQIRQVARAALLG